MAIQASHRGERGLCLVTGAGGFCGPHLWRFLRDSWSEMSLAACGSGSPPAAIEASGWHSCDLRNREATFALVRKLRPRTVFHLAGSGAGAAPADLVSNTVNATLHLLEACREHADPEAGILLVGSAAAFGEMRAEEAGLGEERDPVPRSLHGAAREAALALGRAALAEWGLRVFLCRPFNIVGPGMPARYAPMALAGRLRSLPRGRQVFPVRDADAVRDFVDVRDVARAWAGIVESGEPGVPYSIGSGRGTSVRQLVESIADLLGKEVEIRDEAPEGARSPVQRSIADPRRLRHDTGWEPLVPLRQSLEDMLAVAYGRIVEVEMPA